MTRQSQPLQFHHEPSQKHNHFKVQERDIRPVEDFSYITQIRSMHTQDSSHYCRSYVGSASLDNCETWELQWESKRLTGLVRYVDHDSFSDTMKRWSSNT